MIQEAEVAQKEAMEEDERKGIVEEYLNTLLPDDWERMDLYARRNYLSEPNSPTVPVGTVKRQEVSNIEIWCECFGKNKEEMRPADSYTISAIMIQVGGWERSNRSRRLSIYGKQKLYERIGERVVERSKSRSKGVPLLVPPLVPYSTHAYTTMEQVEQETYIET